MAAPFFTTPFQPYVYQSPEDVVIPFQILGGEAQIVQIMLKPDEKVIARPGSICYMSGSMEMENVYQPENEAGIWQWLLGKTVSSVVVRNSGQSDGFVGIAAPSLARILPIDLAVLGGEILCQPDAFLCSVYDVKVSNAVNQRIRNIPDGVKGENQVIAVLTGPGIVFIQSLSFHRLAQCIARRLMERSLSRRCLLWKGIFRSLGGSGCVFYAFI